MPFALSLVSIELEQRRLAEHGSVDGGASLVRKTGGLCAQSKFKEDACTWAMASCAGRNGLVNALRTNPCRGCVYCVHTGVSSCMPPGTHMRVTYHCFHGDRINCSSHRVRRAA